MPFTSLRLSRRRPRCLPRGYPAAPNTLGEHLRRCRIDRGQTQRTVAQALRVREKTVHLWETSRALPSARHHGAIVAFLGYDPVPAGDGLPARLDAARRRLGLTLAELADRAGFDEGSLIRWLNQSRRPSPWMEGRLRVAVDRLEGRAGDATRASFLDLTRWKRKAPLDAVPVSFGERLRAKRLELGLSQAEAGRQLGTGRATVNRWERDECRPAQSREPALARFLEREEAEGDPNSSK